MIIKAGIACHTHAFDGPLKRVTGLDLTNPDDMEMWSKRLESDYYEREA